MNAAQLAQFDDIMATFDAGHPAFLVMEFNDRECEFLQSIERLGYCRPQFPLSPKQGAWLKDIHANMQRQLKQFAREQQGRPKQPADAPPGVRPLKGN